MQLKFEFTNVSIIVETHEKHISELNKLFNNASDPYEFMASSSLLDIDWIGTNLHND